MSAVGDSFNEVRAEAIRRVLSLVRTAHGPTEVGNAFGGYDCVCGEPWLPEYDRCTGALRVDEDLAARVVDVLGDMLTSPVRPTPE